jgi:anaerobic selenocysteine-containing dehydrogenase
MTTVKRTYCRICEAHCGLSVEVDEETQRVGAVRPDREHLVSKGYCCVKGLGVGAMHDDEERLNYPMKRAGSRYERITWKQALEEIGSKVRKLRKEWGPRSIALYTGNPTYFSFQNILMSSAFLEALHSPNLFASHSVDNNNKLHVSTAMYGRSMVHPVPDLEHIEFFMCMGSNPVVSQMSMVQLPNALERLQRIEARGGRVVIVDPRRTETAQKVGEHVSIQPQTDAYLLMAMLHVIAHEDGIDLEPAKAIANGVEEFVAIAAPWTPERVAAVTGVDPSTIRELTRAYRNANGAALYMSTGVNMGPFGSIAYWLLQGLNLITGNIDRHGGLLVPRGPFDSLKLAGWLGLGSFNEHRTLRGDWHQVAGCFPVSALPGEIDNEDPRRIRALFVSAGNPVHSMPNGAALAQAFEKLSLLVSIDIYRNETSAYADYLLPATDMLERSDYPASHSMLQVTPHAQYTPAIVRPKYERREEWRIFSDLALACGAKPWGKVGNVLPRINRLLARLPGELELTPDHVLALLMRWGGEVTLEQLKQEPGGVFLPPNEPGTFFGRRVASADGKVQLYPEDLASDLPRLHAEERRLRPQPGRLVLIGQRDRRSHNSWMHNSPHIRQPSGNRALIHPEDAAALSIADGDEIEIQSQQGGVRVLARLSDEMRPGVIAVPHGWGHKSAPVKRAAALPGANINEVIPGGQENLEPVSGMAIMMGHRVEVRRVEARAGTTAEREHRRDSTLR